MVRGPVGLVGQGEVMYVMSGTVVTLLRIGATVRMMLGLAMAFLVGDYMTCVAVFSVLEVLGNESKQVRVAADLALGRLKELPSLFLSRAFNLTTVVTVTNYDINVIIGW